MRDGHSNQGGLFIYSLRGRSIDEALHVLRLPIEVNWQPSLR